MKHNFTMMFRIGHKESLPYLKFDDNFLTEILVHFHGWLFYEEDGKEYFLCNAMMMYLDKNNTDD